MMSDNGSGPSSNMRNNDELVPYVPITAAIACASGGWRLPCNVGTLAASLSVLSLRCETAAPTVSTFRPKTNAMPPSGPGRPFGT